ncbi:LacI family DNA-binding transcriptional regulator [Hirschia baltica]|uniref:Transcriptional regulator, LacI family n=1 Tax=Hirschia baltica (strain ATCC 49814 / DSM 5838 / IFAM 1418) TaxID=582402 RepID=C6XQH7_HIRBI|nr:LacI family DNA-binding transcriptional regulator [Hirschia baltica]ACT60476.1 transcriptional regulator, LacI family [Hirschia baltica ATCC 49814]
MTEAQNSVSRRLTIVDVAREANVSVKTVSRVLNDQKGVGETTRQRVRDIMNSMGYQINKAARDLRLNRPTLVALVLDNPTTHMSAYNADLQIGAMRACNKMGYYLIVDDFGSQECIFEEILENPDLAGMIIAPSLADNFNMLNTLDKRGIPYVRIAPQSEIDRSCSVLIDDKSAAYELGEHLLELGHTRIGIIKGHPQHRVSEIRYQGVVEAFSSVGISIDPKLVLQSFFDFKSGMEAAAKLLCLPDRPTAIVAANDDVAAAVVAVAAKKGIKVPEQLSVVGFDNSPISQSIYPSLTTVNQPVIDMSRIAAELLITGALSGEEQTRRVELDYEVVFRDSTSQLRN